MKHDCIDLLHVKEFTFGQAALPSLRAVHLMIIVSYLCGMAENYSLLETH